MKGTPLQLMASKFALKEQIFATTYSKWSLKTVNRNTSGARRSSNLHNPDLGPWQLTSLSGRSWLGWELGGRRGLAPLPSRRRGGLLRLCLLSRRRHRGHQLRGVIVVIKDVKQIEGCHFGGTGEDEAVGFVDTKPKPVCEPHVLIIGIRELRTRSKMPRTLSKSGLVQYLELLDLLLLLDLPLPDDVEHLANHGLDPLGELLREGLPEEEGVEDILALIVVAYVTPLDGGERLSPSKSVCSTSEVQKVT
jgi:hypothetical protein